MLVGVAVLMFARAGSLTWGWAWVLLGLYLTGSLLAGSPVLRLHPETIAARATIDGVMLRVELPGYALICVHGRFRLVPGVG